MSAMGDGRWAMSKGSATRVAVDLCALAIDGAAAFWQDHRAWPGWRRCVTRGGRCDERGRGVARATADPPPGARSAYDIRRGGGRLPAGAHQHLAARRALHDVAPAGAPADRAARHP